jgi:hypothetical protein
MQAYSARAETHRRPSMTLGPRGVLMLRVKDNVCLNLKGIVVFAHKSVCPRHYLADVGNKALWAVAFIRIAVCACRFSSTNVLEVVGTAEH